MSEPVRDRTTGRPRRSRRGEPNAHDRVHRIGRIRGHRLWSVHLTSEHTPGGPRITLRQRWTLPILSAVGFLALAGLIFSIDPGETSWTSAVRWFALVIVAPWMAAMVLARRAFVTAGPEGLTTLGNLNLRPRTLPWTDLELIEVCYLGLGGRFETLRTLVSVRGPATDGALRGVASLWALSNDRDSRNVGLVLLATAHRYGVDGVYVRVGTHARMLGEDDFRYLDPPPADASRPLGGPPPEA